MSAASLFPPTREAALARIAAVRPAEYARSRNAIEGAVTQLSPYISHGLVSLPEVLAGVAERHKLSVQHKLVFELGWRAYFHHVWAHRGNGIFESLHTGPLPERAYATDLPPDIRQACTGVPAIDQAVRTLYATGTLHNHARMWLASYVVHMRKVHWRAGADWLYSHLLDGDLASNHLSWQWVAGTGSHKPYLFNADNVAKYAPPSWHSTDSGIDQSYEALQTLAHSTETLHPNNASGQGVGEPALSNAPPIHLASLPDPAEVAGRDVWLVHPWALGPRPSDLPADGLALGWWPSDFHHDRPWSAARWGFVGTRMAELAPKCWVASATGLAAALAGARSVQTLANPHIDALLPSRAVRRPDLNLFPPVDRPCGSFSQWWTRTLRNVQQLHQLPGLIAMADAPPAGALFG